MVKLPVIVGATLISISATYAQERALNGDEITAILPTIMVTGIGTVQTFSASGSTTYVSDGWPSQGTWWTTATQYCSTWPPSFGQACYDVLLDDAHDPALLIWVSQSGQRIVNKINTLSME